jgi:hypothetical protein
MFRETYCSDNPNYVGEVNITPVQPRAFKKWSKNIDYPLPLQYKDKIVTFNIMKKPHNSTAEHITRYIIYATEDLIGDRTTLSAYTGCNSSLLSRFSF